MMDHQKNARGRALGGAILLGGALLSIVASAAFAQTDRPVEAPASNATFVVKSSLVLVPVFAYDESRMERAPIRELPCVRVL
jgi:hypothetical protein